MDRKAFLQACMDFLFSFETLRWKISAGRAARQEPSAGTDIPEREREGGAGVEGHLGFKLCFGVFV